MSQWTDQSGNGNHLIAAGGARPVYSAADAAFGGKPSLTWDGIATTMQTTGNITLGALTYVLALKCTVANNYIAVFKDDSTDYFYSSNTFSSFVTRGANSAFANLGANWLANATSRTIARTFDGTIAGHKIYANGVDLGATPTGAVDPGVGTLSQVLFIGSNQTPATFLAMSVAEIAVYNRALSAAEILAMHTYMQGRYGY